jgi:hypothetical protein
VWDEGYIVLYDGTDSRLRRESQESWRIAARADELLSDARKPRLASARSSRLSGLRQWWHWLRWKQL